MATVHELKTVPSYFAAVALGMKTFDIRFNDRGFEVGDLLFLREYEAREGGGYTGRACVRKITYVMADPQYVLEGSVVLGIVPIDVPAMIERLLTPGCRGVTTSLDRPGVVHCDEHGWGPGEVDGRCRFAIAADVVWSLLENPGA